MKQYFFRLCKKVCGLNRRKKEKVVACILLCCMILVGCGQRVEEKTEGIKIVTSFYPIYVLAAMITEGVTEITLENMVQPQTGCIHDYQLTTADLKALEQAELFLINGQGMESFLDSVLRQKKDLMIVDTSINAEVLKSEHGHNHEEELHEEEVIKNGHIWLSPENALGQAEVICQAVSAVYPEGKAQFAQNLEEFRQEVEDMVSVPKYSQKQKAIVFHEGFGYLADFYGFTIVDEIVVEQENTPSAKEIAHAIDHAKAEGVTVFFAAEDAGKPYAELVAREVGGKVFLLQPMTTGPLEKEAYSKAFWENNAVIQEAWKQ